MSELLILSLNCCLFKISKPLMTSRVYCQVLFFFFAEQHTGAIHKAQNTSLKDLVMSIKPCGGREGREGRSLLLFQIFWRFIHARHVSQRVDDTQDSPFKPSK